VRRWIFAALVLANLGLLLWGAQFLEPERPARTEAADEVNPERMKLLSEIPANKLVARPKPPPPAPPAAANDGRVCYRLGPITDAAKLKQLEQALGARPLAFTKREEATSAVSGYRVFLPSFKSKDEAERKRRELTKLGFRDHALMHEDGFQNAISLGLYSVEENARNHLKRLADKGVTAEMQAIEQTHALYWVEVAPTESATDWPQRLMADLGEIAGADVTEMPCPAPVVPSPAATEPAQTGN
jgi:hypothetical protein